MAHYYTPSTMLAGLGRMAITPVQELGRVGIFFFRGVAHLFSFPLQADKLIDQVYFIGMKSVFVICLTGAFTGWYWVCRVTIPW
jgi:phospholipid/cholesterol/gamma-HCH transport system permease protein